MKNRFRRPKPLARVPDFYQHPACEDCTHRWSHEVKCRNKHCGRVFKRDRRVKLTCSEKCSAAFRNDRMYERRKAALREARMLKKAQRAKLRLVRP